MSNEDYSKMTELELRQLDWDRMTPEQFMLAEKRAQDIRINLKKKRYSRHRSNEAILPYTNRFVRIYGNVYDISDRDYKYLVQLKSPQKIDDMKAQIAARYTPIENVADDLIETLV